jgi:hypothetical protein
LVAQLLLIEARVLSARGEVEEAITKLRKAHTLSLAFKNELIFSLGDIMGLLAGLCERTGRTAEARGCDEQIQRHASEVKYSGAAVRLAKMAPSEGEVLSLCKELTRDVERRPYFKRLVMMVPTIAEILQQLESATSPGEVRAAYMKAHIASGLYLHQVRQDCLYLISTSFSPLAVACRPRMFGKWTRYIALRIPVSM